MKTNRKPKDSNAPVFTARDYPPASFSLSTDGRKARQRRIDRRNLYLQIATYGKLAFPSVKTLATAMGWSRSKTFRVLDDLKVLGCLLDATDAQGRKYTWEHGSRVRSVDTDVLPVPGSSPWLPVEDVLTSDGVPLLVQFVNKPGVLDSKDDNKQESQAENQESQIEKQESHARRDPKELAERSTERTTPTPKEEPAAGSGSPEEQDMDEGEDIDEEQQAIYDKAYEEYQRQHVHEFLVVIKELPLPDGLRTGISYEGIVALYKVVSAEIPARGRRWTAYHLLLSAWRVFLEERDFGGLTKTTAWKLFVNELVTDWLPKVKIIKYPDRLLDPRGAETWKSIAQLLDEIEKETAEMALV